MSVFFVRLQLVLRQFYGRLSFFVLSAGKKNPHAHEFLVLEGVMAFFVLSAGKPPMPIKFLVLGGGGSRVFLGKGGGWKLSAPQRCNAEHSDAQRNFFTSQFIPPFLQRHRCDALPCFSASPVTMFYIAHIAFPPLLPFSLSP